MFKCFFRLAVLLTPLLAEADSKLWDATNEAYGFLLGQRITHQIIEKKFPNLSPESAKANLAFSNSPYGKSFQSIENQIADGNSDADWPSTKAHLYKVFSDSLSQKIVNEANAMEFINNVFERAKGNIPQNIRSALLANNPDFYDDFSKEIDAGLSQKFNFKEETGKEHPNFSLHLPMSWKKGLPNDKDEVVNYEGMSGRDIISLSVSVKKLNIPTWSTLGSFQKELFSPSSLESMVPPKEKLINTSAIEVDNLTFGVIATEISSSNSSLNRDYKMRSLKYVTIHQSYIIHFRVLIARTAISKESIQASQDRIKNGFEGLFKNYFKPLKN
jgi:hypothetical protein